MNYFFLVATLELMLAAVLLLAGEMMVGATLSLCACALLVIGMTGFGSRRSRR